MIAAKTCLAFSVRDPSVANANRTRFGSETVSFVAWFHTILAQKAVDCDYHNPFLSVDTGRAKFVSMRVWTCTFVDSTDSECHLVSIFHILDPTQFYCAPLFVIPKIDDITRGNQDSDYNSETHFRR